MSTRIPEQPESTSSAYSRPPAHTSGDWTAHIATTIDRLAALLETLSPEQWEAASMCEDWRVRDVVGHIIWRNGASNAEMAKTGLPRMLRRGFRFNAVLDELAREEAAAPTSELLARLRAISASKTAGEGRIGVYELTEAVVHAYDISEALELPLRLSPRSTGAVALTRLRMPFPNAHRKWAAKHALRATDARWQIGSGEPVEATAAQIIMHLFDRRYLDA